MPIPRPRLLLLLLLLLAAAASAASAVRFDYATLTLGSLRLLGDAHLKNGTIRLSRDLPVPNSGAGRALYATAVPLRAGFSTQFAFTVATLNPSSVGGGLAFVVAKDDASLGDAGPYIGGVMEVYVSYSPKRPPEPVLSAPLDLGEYVKDQAFVGFAASTQGSTEMHAARKRTALAVAADKRDSLASAAAFARSPREFTYKELSAATRGFDASRVIGNGAFGTVYRGIIPDTGAMLLLSLQDSVSDYNALGLNLSDSSSDSLSSSSLTSTLRKGGHDIGGFSSTAGDTR
ncbi:hypothetical protein ABZP36_029278 [Zizania latifolia]